MNTAIAGFLGALIGAGASLLGLVIQQHYQTKREVIKIATEVGLSEFKISLEDMHKYSPAGTTMPPPAAYVIFHLGLLKELSKGEINAEKLRELGKKHDALMAAFKNPRTD